MDLIKEIEFSRERQAEPAYPALKGLRPHPVGIFARNPGGPFLGPQVAELERLGVTLGESLTFRRVATPPK